MISSTWTHTTGWVTAASPLDQFFSLFHGHLLWVALKHSYTPVRRTCTIKRHMFTARNLFLPLNMSKLCHVSCVYDPHSTLENCYCLMWLMLGWELTSCSCHPLVSEFCMDIFVSKVVVLDRWVGYSSLFFPFHVISHQIIQCHGSCSIHCIDFLHGLKWLYTIGQFLIEFVDPLG